MPAGFSMTFPAQQPEQRRIYLAGSWKNQQEILLIRDILKSQGHVVDCFASEENGRISFNWSKLSDIQDKLPQMDAKDMLEVPRVQEAFREDKKWIDWCNICILTLPSGKSSHLEAGYAKGQGKTVVIFGDLQKGDFDVMYGFADAIFRCDEIDQMVDFVNRTRPHPPAPENVWSADPKKGCEPCKNTECGYCAMRTENIKQHDAATTRAATLAENKRCIKILEDYRFGLEYPDCPPGDCIKKLVEQLRQQAEEARQ